ncbi:CDP-glucose 4,6-dehydratase [Candidatus Woesearchaeota archaeon CG07_land_8_20_14_0_80_44_23]|nr:MAG: CDP-glucose 4,6-dehydratase [Candidatus Woesearchaeota archaeon CG07_land_8_20_14_0_80_44_23]
MEGLNIYKGKKVLVTGHTGFKGAWLSIWLIRIGAKVIGFSLPKSDNDYVYKQTGLGNAIFADEKGEIRDYKQLKKVFDKYKPDFVFHLAAQPLVRLSYEIPLETFEANVIGTANVLECIRKSSSVKGAVLITTDKCYKNKETITPYKETDELGGYDPYSSSKACAEIVIGSYRDAFFRNSDILIASARAGNVLGGGDFGKDRLVPDCINSLIKGKPIRIRNPNAVRPWQYILDVLYGYLLLGKKLLEGRREFAEPWNFGPEQRSIVPVRKIADLMVKEWGSGSWQDCSNSKEKKHEAKLLNLDITKAKKKLGWKPKLTIDENIKQTVRWYRNERALGKGDVLNLCYSEIAMYEKKR